MDHLFSAGGPEIHCVGHAGLGETVFPKQLFVVFERTTRDREVFISKS